MNTILEYNVRGWISPEHTDGSASYHAFIKPDGEYRFRIRDCVNAMRLHGALNTPQNIADAVTKLRTLAMAANDFANYIESNYPAIDKPVPAGWIVVPTLPSIESTTNTTTPVPAEAVAPKPKWNSYTTEEDDLIRRLYPTTASKDIARQLGRSCSAICKRAFNLGIHKGNNTAMVNPRVYSEADDDLIRRLYPNTSTEELAKQMNRTPAAIQRRASYMGIYKTKPAKDAPAEEPQPEPEPPINREPPPKKSKARPNYGIKKQLRERKKKDEVVIPNYRKGENCQRIALNEARVLKLDKDKIMLHNAQEVLNNAKAGEQGKVPVTIDSKTTVFVTPARAERLRTELKKKKKQ